MLISSVPKFTLNSVKKNDHFLILLMKVQIFKCLTVFLVLKQNRGNVRRLVNGGFINHFPKTPIFLHETL